jgi:cytochrome c-type biogenesis protein CcmH/NrfF
MSADEQQQRCMEQDIHWHMIAKNIKVPKCSEHNIYCSAAKQATEAS